MAPFLIKPMKAAAALGKRRKAPVTWLHSQVQEKPPWPPFTSCLEASKAPKAAAVGSGSPAPLRRQPVAWHGGGAQCVLTRCVTEGIIFLKASLFRIVINYQFSFPQIMEGLLKQVCQYPKKLRTFCHSQERVNLGPISLKRLPHCGDLTLYLLRVKRGSFKGGTLGLSESFVTQAQHKAHNVELFWYLG